MAQSAALRKPSPAKDGQKQNSAKAPVDPQKIPNQAYIFPPGETGPTNSPTPATSSNNVIEEKNNILKLPSTNKFTSKAAIKALSTDFAISNEEHRAWALEFIADLFPPILSSRARKEGFLPDYQVSVWSAGNESPKKLETHDGERIEVAESKYLFPSDVIMLVTSLAEKANVPHYSVDYYLDQARVSENQFSEKLLGAGGASPIYQLAQSFPDLSQVLAKWGKSTEEGEAKMPGEIPAEDDQRNADQAEVATAKVPAGGTIGSDSSASEAGGTEEVGAPLAETQPTQPTTPEQTTEQQSFLVAQRKTAAEKESRALLTREQAKAIRYESAWIYHHAAFELFGEAGFLDNNQLDQRFNILDTEVKKYFQFNSDPEQLKSLFANPVERLRALQRIYTNLAANPEFAALQAKTKEAVGLGEVATAQARELEKRLPSRDKSTFSTLFEDKKLASQIVQAELANKLESVIKVDGARLINMGYSIDAVAMGLGSPQLAAQLNLPTNDKKDVQTFLESLDGEKINMIFFGGQLTKEEEKIIDQKENGVLIKKILAGALTARAIDISTISESIHILSGVATEAELELLVQALPSASIPNVRNAIASSDKLEDTDGTEITSRALTKNITQSRREFELQANKIWQSLSVHAQEWAYAEWLGIGPADIELIRGTDQHLPFNKILAGLNWDEFVKNARKLDQSLKKLDGGVSDLAGLRQISKELRSLNVSELLRDSWIKQYLNGLSKEQLAFLAKTQFIKKIERSLALAETAVAQYDPTTSEWRNAAVIIRSTQNLVDNEQLSLNMHPALSSEYLRHLDTIKQRQAALAALIERGEISALTEPIQTKLTKAKELVSQAETLYFSATLQAAEFPQARKMLEDARNELASLEELVEKPVLRHANLKTQAKAEIARLRTKISQVEQSPETSTDLSAEIKTELVKASNLITQAETLLISTHPDSEARQTAKNSLGTANQILNTQLQQITQSTDEKDTLTPLVDRLVERADRVKSTLNSIQYAHLPQTSDIVDELEYEQFFGLTDTTLSNELTNTIIELNSLTPATASGSDGSILLLLSASPEAIVSGSEEYNQAVQAIDDRAALGVDEQSGADTGAKDTAAGSAALPPKPIDTARHTIAAAKNMAQTAKMLSTAARAAAGDVTAMAKLGVDFARFWSDPENRQKVYNIIGGVVGGGIGALIAIVSRLIGAVGTYGGAALGALSGGGIGFLLGGPLGAAVGASIGGFAGWQAGDKLAAKYAMEGVADLYPSQLARARVGAPTTLPTTGGEGGGAATGMTEVGGGVEATDGLSGGALDGGVGVADTAAGADGAYFNSLAQGAGQPEFIGPRQEVYSDAYGNPLDPTNPYAGQSAAAASTSTGAMSTLTGAGAIFAGPAIAMGAIYLLTIGTIFTIFSAFLVPQPTGDSTAKNTRVTEHVEFYKTALPKTIVNNSSSTVEYKIVARPLRGQKIVITDVKDEFSFIKDLANQAAATNPTLSPASDYLPIPPIEPQSTSIVLSYSIVMSGGRDVLVRNTASITYDVYSRDGELVASNQSSGDVVATVRIGNPQVFCWPTTGIITQLPYASFSHRSSDAYDIAGAFGTKIFAPFGGQARRAGSLSGGGYGLYVVLDSTNFGQFVFAHLSRVGSIIPSSGSVVVEPGDLLGYMGNSGNVKPLGGNGTHLHYEHRNSNGQKILQTLVPEIPLLYQKVYTCF